MKFYLIMICIAGIASPVYAAQFDPKPVIKWQSTIQYIQEDNKDLGESEYRPTKSLAEQLQLSLKLPVDNKRYLYFKSRAYNFDSNHDYISGSGLDSIGTSTDRKFLEMRELYYHQKLEDYYVRLGRQKFREDRSLWWNDELDSVRVGFKNNNSAGFVALADNLYSYRTDKQEDGQDKNRLRILGEYIYSYADNHTIEPRFLFEHDHSGSVPFNDIIDADAADREDSNAAYMGLRTKGVIQEKWRYRSDIIGLLGREKKQDFTRISGSNSYRAGTLSHDDVRAWALDTSIDYDPDMPGGRIFKAGYAFGSGDRDGGSDTEFRQSGLEGNSSRNDNERPVQRNYGEVFRPELSNMHIATLGVTQDVNDDLQLGADYFYYRQAEKGNDVRRSGILANVNNHNAFLGQELDISATYDAGKALSLDNNIADKVQLRTIGGVFMPGKAYDDGNENPAFRLYSEIKIQF